MKRRNFLLGCICVIAAAVVTVMGTLAFLTDRDSVKNTFTVGNIDITVDESAVNSEGKPVDGAQRVQSNEYHLLPGCRYTKDPTVTVEANSEEAYVRMILTVHNASAVQAVLDKYQLGDFAVLIDGWNAETWLYHGFEADAAENVISFEFRYKEPVAAGEEAVVLPPLFDTLVVPGEMSGEELQALYDGGFRMEIFGHAIQTASFDTEEQAWEAFDKQVNP